MSYPEPRWHGDGRTGALFHPAGAPADLVTPDGRISYLATGATTGGELGLYRYVMGEQPAGPAPHFHRTISESFFVLSGTVRLYDGRAWVDAVAGDFLHVPVGGIHAFRNQSGAPVEMLLLFVPGAPREAYFEELAEMAASGRALSERERTEFLARHDQFMV